MRGEKGRKEGRAHLLRRGKRERLAEAERPPGSNGSDWDPLGSASSHSWRKSPKLNDMVESRRRASVEFVELTNPQEISTSRFLVEPQTTTPVSTRDPTTLFSSSRAYTPSPSPKMSSRPSPSIPQDTLSLTLYLPPSSSSSLSTATALAAQINTFIYSDLLPKSWIWHRDSLDLKIVKKEASSRLKKQGGEKETELDEWRLEGIMRVGDSIEDEWVAVWLVKEITGKWEGVVGS